MIAITTNNSIKVKPLQRPRRAVAVPSEPDLDTLIVLRASEQNTARLAQSQAEKGKAFFAAGNGLGGLFVMACKLPHLRFIIGVFHQGLAHQDRICARLSDALHIRASMNAAFGY